MNVYLQYLKNTFILFLVLGGSLALIALFVTWGAAESNNGAGDPAGQASALVWFGIGSSFAGFGFLAMLFYFLASSVDYRLTHPTDESPEPRSDTDEAGAPESALKPEATIEP